MSTFEKAVKHEAKLRLAIAGPSGSGKTYSALAIATALGGKVAVVDTEHGSASKYADTFFFDVLELYSPFHPDRFGEAIKDAFVGGYSTIILDSLTHAWSGPGGLLDIVDEAAKRMKSANSFAAWKEGTPIQNRLVEDILSAPLHVIATMRSKQEYAIEQDSRGKNVPRKIGTAPIQRDGFEYEFDVFLEMDQDNNAVVTKTRCPNLTGRVFNKPSSDIAAILGAWLTGQPVKERKPISRESAIMEERNDGIVPQIAWPEEWISSIIRLKYAENDFQARGMLDKSDVIPGHPELTQKQVMGWAKHYREARKGDSNDSEQAAALADIALLAHLDTVGAPEPG